MTRRRRFVAWCGASVLLAAAAHAAPPRTPCDVPGLPAAVEQIARRIETGNRAVWATLARDAAALSAEGSPAARACAHYSAGAAHFFLSVRGTRRRRHAAAAARHLVSAEALAPQAMLSRQPQKRLANAWKRMGTIRGWLPEAAKPVAVELPARTGTVTLTPGSDASWRTLCSATCSASMAITLPLDADATRSVHLRPGRWRVALTTACGEARAVVELDGGVLRLPPDPPCAVELVPHDDNTPIEPFRAVDAQGKALTRVDARHNPITLHAPGYTPATVTVPATGGRLPVAMSRCAVDLQVTTVPGDAQVEGAGPQPWGEARVVARRAGYADQAQTVRIPRAARCSDARHAITLTLRRRVAVVATDSTGDPVVLSRLWVDDAVVDPADLALAPGPHRFQAEHVSLGLLSGRVVVDACSTGRCPAARLRVEFERAASPDRTGPYLVMGGGVAVGLLGLGFGVAAVNAQADVDAYTVRRQESRPIAEIIAERDDYARVADTALLTGSALIIGGIIWLASGGD